MPDIATTKKILKVAFKAKVTPLMVSHTGMAKSAISKQVCFEMFGETNEDGSPTYVDIRLGQKEVGDLTGVPLTKEIDKIIYTKWGIPEMYPMSGNGIIHLDEINRASSQDVINCVFELIYDGKLHTYMLPKGRAICASMNPADGKYQVLMTDDAFTARCIIIDVYPTYEEWLKWAESEIGLKNEELKNFGRTLKGNEQNSFLFREKLDTMEKYGYIIKPRPRSWELFDRMLEHVDDHDEKLISAIGEGLMGMEFTSAFQRFKKESYERPLLGNQILEQFPKFKSIIKQWCQPGQLKGELIASTSRNIHSYVSEHFNNDSKITPKEEIFKNLWDYVRLLYKNSAADQSHEMMNRIISSEDDEKDISNFSNGLIAYINKGKDRKKELSDLQNRVSPNKNKETE